MSALADWEAQVASLWERSDALPRDEAVAAMRELAGDYPGEDGRAAFELGGMYDSHGFEHEAEREYERARELGLAPEQHAQLAVQYGSTLRNTGRVDDAIAVLEAAPTHPSTGAAPRVFLALALHAAGRHDEAMRVIVEAIEPTLPRYNRSVRAYAAALTEPAA
ncbi:tetratricopeptide repeat protein [Agrococcus sp. ProA11]|uniref:tetratricopeptide repeat protein n=1 Tax=Agrococcus chionoecetis TaxID=3153752 RepID=UPI0032602449